MKKSLLFLCAALCLLPYLFSCGKPAARTVQEKDLRKTLTIAVDDYAPYSYLDENGEFAGIDVELARAACERIGYTPSFQLVIWNEKDDYLEQGLVDCLWSCFSMNGRETLYQWVGPYLKSRQVYIVSAASDIYTPADLSGKTVAVHSGTKPEQLFLERTEDMPEFKSVYSLSSIDNIFAALRKGYVDACATHEAIVRSYVERDPGRFRVLEQEIYNANLGIAFSNENTDAPVARLETALAEMKQDGTTRAVLQRYGIDPEKAIPRGAE